MYKHILLPSDGSELSLRSIRHGMRLAKTMDAKVTGFFARPHLPYDYYEGLVRVEQGDLESQDKRLDQVSREVIQQFRSEAAAANIACGIVTVVSDSPYQAIIQAAKENGCDLIVMASHGRRGLEGLVLGSETQKVLTHCAIPVLVTR